MIGRILGVDHGERRLGLAISDVMGILATPLRTVEVSSDADSVKAVCEACAETEAVGIVVGLPLNMDGTVGPIAKRVRAFCDMLRKAIDLDVEEWDERLSSAMVERVLLDADMSRRKRKKVRDKLAAQVILSGYLDSKAEPEF
jgi:putative Holliday junction resolvase